MAHPSSAPEKIDRTAVKSSHLASVGYHPETGTLEVELSGGNIYRYAGVPERIHRDLMASSSKGQYFNRFIKGHYSHTKI